MSKDLLVGALFLAAIAILGGLSLSVGSLTFFQTPTSITVEFEEVSGLSEGDEVRVRGVNIGRVQKIHPPTENGVEVDLSLDAFFERREGTAFRVRPQSALGGTFVEFEPGRGRPLNSVDLESLRGTGSDDPFAAIADFIGENRGTVGNILTQIDAALTNLNEGDGLLPAMLTNEEFRERFRLIADELTEILTKTNNGDGPIARALNDKELAASFDRVPRILDGMESVTNDLRDGKGPLGAMISDEEMAAQLRRAFQDIDDKRGLVGRAIGDTEFADQVQSAVQSIDRTFVSVREGEGLIARLLTSPGIADDVQGTFSNLADVSEKVNKGSGTVARLINEDNLLEDASDTLILLRDVTEDAREQAPVNAFLNALFGFF